MGGIGVHAPALTDQTLQIKVSADGLVTESFRGCKTGSVLGYEVVAAEDQILG